MIPAYVVHELRGRLRLRIPVEHRGDETLFQSIADRLLQIEGVDAVSTDALTGSVLIHHALPGDDLKAQLTREDLFNLETPPPRPVRHGFAPLSKGISAFDNGLREVSGGAADLRTLLFLTLVGLAIRQAARGEIMIPAAALLWNAFALVLGPHAGAPHDQDA